MSRALVWFGNDLRLTDNPALYRACREHMSVIPVYVHDPEAEHPWSPGGAARWWLHHSLNRLQASIAARGGMLVIRRGAAIEIIPALVSETGACAVYWNTRYEPALAARDVVIESLLRDRGVAVERSHGNVLFAPGTVLGKQGQPLRVFTPFSRACRALDIDTRPLPAPSRLEGPVFTSAAIADLDLLPRIAWDSGLKETWRPGEEGASQRLCSWVEQSTAIAAYPQRRDIPATEGTSRLSPHLHFGEIGPRQIWAMLVPWLNRAETTAGAEAVMRQLLWREFAIHILAHYPHTAEHCMDTRFNHFPWTDANGALWERWTRGLTGVPIVDAGMRELWATGWMHNRVRMIAASWLTKNSCIHWRHGARWFWDTLVDADLANNTLNWQWVAGCGADAAPYFRIFSPVRQGERFDPDGDYVRRWVPELAPLPSKFIHIPWAAPSLLRATLNYPAPVLDPDLSRREALVVMQNMAGASGMGRVDGENGHS